MERYAWSLFNSPFVKFQAEECTRKDRFSFHSSLFWMCIHTFIFLLGSSMAYKWNTLLGLYVSTLFTLLKQTGKHILWSKMTYHSRYFVCVFTHLYSNLGFPGWMVFVIKRKLKQDGRLARAIRWWLIILKMLLVIILHDDDDDHNRNEPLTWCNMGCKMFAVAMLNKI